MNKENAKEYLPLVQDLAAGKTIQRACVTLEGEKIWRDETEPNFGLPPYCYRTKPEPTYRPYKDRSEFPVGCWLREKGGEGKHWRQASEIGKNGVNILGHGICFWNDLFDSFDQSTDNCKTWQPCGVLV